MIRFANLIRRYSVPCVLIRIAETWTDDGEAIRTPTSTPMRMAILPIDTKMMQLEGGRYKMDDKALYSLTPLRIGDQIQYSGGKFTVDQAMDYSEYADFNKYIAKRVSTHG